MKHILYLFFCSLLLTSCAPVTVNTLDRSEAVNTLTAASILQLVEGNTLFIHSFSEDSHLYFDTSGSVFAKDIYNNTDTGKWDVSEDGELCLRLGKWWYGDLRCFSVLEEKNQYHLANTAGVLEYSAQKSAGDSENLFYVKKQKKKSYRRSVKSGSPGKQSKKKDQATAQEKTTTAQLASDTKQPSGNSDKKDIRSTVKWMARDCPGCNLADTDLKKADLVGAHLAGANLKGALLKMANLRRADLEGANLKNANMSYANLPGANLKNADLRGANLKGANLIRANLTGAKLENTNFTEAIVEGVIGLQK